MTPAAPGRRSRGGWRRRCTWIFLAGGVLFLLAEAGVRLKFREQLRICRVPLIYAPDAYLGYRYVPNSSSEICLPSICKTVKINSAGYHDGEFAATPAPGVFRIAVAGGSNVSGVWMDGERTFSTVLQELFWANGLNVEVMNFGVDGVGRSLATLRLLESEVLQRAPALVLLEAELPIAQSVPIRELHHGYLCDIGNSSMSKREIAERREYVEAYVQELDSMLLDVLFDHCHVFRAIHKKLCAIHRVGRASPFERNSTLLRLQHYKTKRIWLAGPPNRLSLDASLVRLAQTRAIVEAAGAELVTFSYAYVQEFAGQFARNGIEYIGLSLPNDPRFRHEFDGHFNELGHERIGQLLFQALRERGHPKTAR